MKRMLQKKAEIDIQELLKWQNFIGLNHGSYSFFLSFFTLLPKVGSVALNRILGRNDLFEKNNKVPRIVNLSFFFSKVKKNFKDFFSLNKILM